MARLHKVMSDKELMLEFNSAKIIASPYDYKLSERLMLYDTYTCFHHFNIFNKYNQTERFLCGELALDNSDKYMSTNPNISLNKITEKVGTVCDYVDFLESEHGYVGTFIKYNNLILNEDTLITDLCGPYHLIDLQRKSYLKALELLYLKTTAKASLIPNLMYLATEFYDRSLEDLENIKFAEEAIAKGEAPFISLFRTTSYEEDLPNNTLLDACLVPINMSAALKEVGNDNFYKLGLVYSIIYGTELLYYLDNIKDLVLKDALEELFAIGYRKDSFCSTHLYTIDESGKLEINPGIKACFCDDNNLRFESIRSWLSTKLKDPDFLETAIYSKLDYYGIPVFFARAIINAHAYAYQIARVKHAVLLYTKAKDAGLINSETFNEIVDNEPGLFGIGSPSEDLDKANELIDLSTFSTTGEPKLSDEELIEKEKSVEKKRSERPPMLNAADMLKKDLHDSRYNFDINYVKNNDANKEAYNLIANNIKMITHELSRQIKEIKTYNTGGKQGGLLVGKLDKKNLWKYKTDPHIFYNNNYKLAEMDLAFGCILDESGSMGGEKIKNGRIVMIMLHEVLNSLGINHSIIGHTSSGMYQSKIFKYYQFKEEAHYSLDKPYGLVKADNRTGNCDSGALFYMQSVMKQVRNKDKIVIIFSDGQPTECTDLDLTEQVRNMEKNGIHVIGVGINFSSIKEYYPDNANGKNLKEMVDIVVSILKRYVLEKKE